MIREAGANHRHAAPGMDAAVKRSGVLGAAVLRAERAQKH
jgi:hypothetical protein